MATKQTKQCACGHVHVLEAGYTEYANRDRHAEIPGHWTATDPPQYVQPQRIDCGCTGYVKPERYDKFQIEHQKHLAKLDTPQERAKIARELERLAEERKRLEPLDVVLRRLGYGKSVGTKSRRKPQPQSNQQNSWRPQRDSNR